MQSSDYDGTSIGFVKNRGPLADPPSGTAKQKISQRLDNAFFAASHKLPSIVENFEAGVRMITPNRTIAALAFASVSAVGIMANPDLAGAAAGEFQAGRQAAHDNKTCIVQESCTPSQKLGEFVGNFEKQFEAGRQAGINHANKNYMKTP
ncbi:MAG: hypothetical protein ACK4NR_07140 [Micavibrio sp.]